MNTVIESYKAIYEAMNFERLGLFRLIAETYACRDVLYPGSSIHITPSFVFPHVVYVDKSPDAKTFFDSREEVADFVERNREYKQKPFIRFIHQDFSRALPLQQQSFDLLLSFFAGKVAPACRKYLRKSGFLLTIQREEADEVPGFKLVTAIHFQRGKYRLIKDSTIPEKQVPKTYLRQSDRGLEYFENATYFVFEKCQ